MKKLTAGILTVMLGIVSANSADAAVASKLYVDAKVKTNADAIGGLTTTVNQHTTDIAEKVSQSAYDTKIGELVQADTSLETAISNEAIARENADNAINTLVGTLPEGATATTIVGYIQERTDDIATDAALGELSDKVTANTGAIATLNGAENEAGSVANKIAGAITALDLANTYDAKGDAATAEQNAKDYADGLINAEVVRANAAYATADQGALADTALQKADITTGSANGTISVEGEDVTVKGLGSAAYTSADAYDPKGSASAVQQNLENFSGVVTTLTDDVQLLKGDANTAGSVAYAVQEAKTQAVSTARQETISKISELNLNELSRVPAECSDAKNYCVLTTNGSKYLWEVIERATDEAQPEGTDIPSVIDDTFGA